MFTPNGTIYLIGGVPLDNTYQHTVDFSSAAQQQSYFQGKTAVTLDQYTFLRKDRSIKVAVNVESLWNVNYMMARNGLGKWIYYFITDKAYVNEATTEISIETDVMQTYQFDYTVKPSFVDREHQDRWSAGLPVLNYVDEGIAYGDEYVKTREFEFTDGSLMWFLAVSSEPLEDKAISNLHLVPEPIQGSPTPFHYYLIPYAKGTDKAVYDSDGKAMMKADDFSRLMSENTSLISVSFIPYLPFNVSVITGYAGVTGDDYQVFSTGELVTVTHTWNGGGSEYGLFKVKGRNTSHRGTKNIGSIGRYQGVNLPSSFAAGQARNHRFESKLLTFPYFLYHLTDYQAPPMVIKNEYIDGLTISVNHTQVISHNPKAKYYINGYKGETDGKANHTANVTVNDLPLTSDAYLNYISENKASITTGMAVQIAQGAVALGVGVATGGAMLPIAIGIATQSAASIAQEMAKRKDLQAVPDSVRSAGNNIAFDIADGNTTLKLVRYEVSAAYKKILGDYFAMYGYKCNEVKTPNTKSRYYYNYIKTIGANITGNIDMVDLARIKQVYDNGVTFWHYRSGFQPLDYTYENVEVSQM